MTAPFSGGCRCGAVRYESRAEPLRVVHCFCTDCQKINGTQMSTNVLVPRDAFAVTSGSPAFYVTIGDSGREVRRFFCRNCGSSLWSEPALIPDVVIIKAGTMDDAGWLRPSASIYLDSAPAWASVPDGIPGFPKMPPG